MRDRDRQDRRGVVYLVGAGPGDPGLITVRGRSLLRRADVVVHDRLIGPELLSEVRSDAEIVDAGKSPGDHRIAQEQINALLVKRAQRDLMVVRLKGGDPFIFGRGFEELTACREAGVKCVVVPGVSSALAAPAAAGIPLTDRRLVRSLAIITGKTASDSQAPDLNYAALAAMDALVVMMGRENLAEIVRKLMDAGREATTPAAMVQWATTPRQRVIVATLGAIAETADREGLQAPVVTVIGAVAAYAKPIARPALPLDGKRIVVTRPASAAGSLNRMLRAAGAEVISCPMIRIDYGGPHDELDRVIGNLERYDWLVFTSRHGVRGFWKRLMVAGRDARSLGRCRIAAVGPTTARMLRRHGLRADLVPQVHSAESLVRAMVERGGAVRPGFQPVIGRVLYPRADIAGRALVEGLRGADAIVDDCVAYRTVEATPSAARLPRLRAGIDAVVFCSPSAVRRWLRLRLEVTPTIIACIGPVTAEAARQAGFIPAVVAESYTAKGLADALVNYFDEVGSVT